MWLKNKDFLTLVSYEDKIQKRLDEEEYNNIIYYPYSSKEWYNNVYNYDKSFIKLLIYKNKIINSLFRDYFNMRIYKFIKLYRNVRARPFKARYSVNRVYTSSVEVKHTNNKILIMIYIYNKQKISIELVLKKILNILSKKKIFYIKSNKKIYKMSNVIYILRNRIWYVLKKKFFFLIYGILLYLLKIIIY